MYYDRYHWVISLNFASCFIGQIFTSYSREIKSGRQFKKRDLLKICTGGILQNNINYDSFDQRISEDVESFQDLSMEKRRKVSESSRVTFESRSMRRTDESRTKQSIVGVSFSPNYTCIKIVEQESEFRKCRVFHRDNCAIIRNNVACV